LGHGLVPSRPRQVRVGLGQNLERAPSAVRGRGRPAQARAPPPARHALHANSTRMHAVKFAVAAAAALPAVCSFTRILAAGHCTYVRYELVRAACHAGIAACSVHVCRAWLLDRMPCTLLLHHALLMHAAMPAAGW
jgi:hypothetical protein